MGLFLWAIGAVLADQIGEFADDAPGYISDIEDWIEGAFDIEVDAQGLLEEFQEGGAVANLATRIGRQPRSTWAPRCLQVLFQILTIVLFTFYLVAEGPKLTAQHLLPAASQASASSAEHLGSGD